MSFPRLLAAFLLLLGSARIVAAETVELADGLTYLRGPVAVADSAPANSIVDLRFITATGLPPPWVKAATHPTIILLAGEDVPAWLTLLDGRSPPVLLLGPKGTAAGLDLEIVVSAEQLGQVVAAIDDGADVAVLAQPIVAKRRFDEAALVRIHNGEEDTNDSEDAPADDETDKKPVQATLSDPMLERAVQVLLGLRVLGRG